MTGKMIAGLVLSFVGAALIVYLRKPLAGVGFVLLGVSVANH